MQSNFSVRPEDFRFAWANAYQIGLQHVAEMQRCIDAQLVAAKNLIALSAEQTEFSRSNLQKTASVIVEELRRDALQNEKQINDATRTLVARAQGLFDREVALRAQTEQLANELRRERLEFERDKKAFLDQPLVLRLWRAFKFRG